MNLGKNKAKYSPECNYTNINNRPYFVTGIKEIINPITTKIYLE